MKALSVIIPVYNEKETLPRIIEKVERIVLPYGYKVHIILVDDGSTDGSSELCAAYKDRHTVIISKINQGKGAALRKGFEYIQGDYVVVQDADLEYDPEDLGRMLKTMIDNNFAVLYGSRTRTIPHQNTTALRFYLGGVSLSWLTNILYGQHITDEATCYKMFTTSLLQSLPLTCTRFEFCPEVTALVSRKGITIPEVKIQYHPRSIEQGKKIRFKDFVEAVWVLISIRLTRNPFKTKA
jgi:dolichol-phosphate mannosyltransferase